MADVIAAADVSGLLAFVTTLVVAMVSIAVVRSGGRLGKKATNEVSV